MAAVTAVPQDWSLYILRTRDGALYTGIAKDVARRQREHLAGRGAKSLRAKGPLTLVYQVAIGTHSRALRTESALKKLSKADKEALVRAQPSALSLCQRLGLGHDAEL